MSHTSVPSQTKGSVDLPRARKLSGCSCSVEETLVLPEPSLEPPPVSLLRQEAEGPCIGYLAYLFEKKAPWAFTIRFFFVVTWH
jgi:hypothetical protein